MSQIMKSAIDGVLGACEALDKAKTVSSRNDAFSLKESFEIDMVRFMVYMSASDGSVDKEEAQLITDYFGYKLTTREMEKVLEKGRLDTEGCISSIPISLQLFVKADNAFFKSQGGYRQGSPLSKSIVKIYYALGKEVLAVDGNATLKEKSDLLIYIENLQDYLNENLIQK